MLGMDPLFLQEGGLEAAGAGFEGILRRLPALFMTGEPSS